MHEFVTINRGTVKGGGVTKHRGNDLPVHGLQPRRARLCRSRTTCILTNGSIIGRARAHAAGRQQLRRNLCAVHQFVTLGRFYAYAGGMTQA